MRPVLKNGKKFFSAFLSIRSVTRPNASIWTNVTYSTENMKTTTVIIMSTVFGMEEYSFFRNAYVFRLGYTDIIALIIVGVSNIRDSISAIWAMLRKPYNII